MRQAGGNHVAWAVGRPDPLAQVAHSERPNPIRLLRQVAWGDGSDPVRGPLQLAEALTQPGAPAGSHIPGVTRYQLPGKDS